MARSPKGTPIPAPIAMELVGEVEAEEGDVGAVESVDVADVDVNEEVADDVEDVDVEVRGGVKTMPIVVSTRYWPANRIVPSPVAQLQLESPTVLSKIYRKMLGYLTVTAILIY